jgi:leucyl-tRNA synthetase
VTPLLKAAYKAVLAVGEDLERLRFNRCIAHVHDLSNTLATAMAAGERGSDLRMATRMMVQLFAPMMPHLAEECWTLLGGEGLIANAPWPLVDRALAADSEIRIPVQVNGKKRGELEIPADASNEAVEAILRAHPDLAHWVGGQPIRKVIVVPKRIVNIVA